MAATIELADIPPAVRKKMGLTRRVKSTNGMKMETVRTYSIRCLGVMADLTQSQRNRILRHALKVNEV